MAPMVDAIGKIKSGSEIFKMKVRVVRLWTVPNFNNPSVLGTAEMIFMDSSRDTIHATIRKPLLQRYLPQFEEGKCYQLSHFNIVPNLGAYRCTDHTYKLVVLYKTVVIPCVMDEIPFYGICSVPFNRVLDSSIDWDHLIDVMGVITSVGQIKEYERAGKTSKMVVIELTSENLKLDCALFGDYVDQLQTYISSCSSDLPIVVIQYAKVKNFRGTIGIQNVMFTTRLLFNPNSDDVNNFRDSISTSGTQNFRPLILSTESTQSNDEEDFMKLTPRSTIQRLHANEEDGCFVIFGIVNAIVEDGPWWYSACRCGRVVNSVSGVFICDLCDAYTFNVTPRFKVKLEVQDETGTAVFVLFERDCAVLFQKICADFFSSFVKSPEAIHNCEYPAVMFDLVGKKLLFKIETRNIGPTQYYGTFRVKRVCDNSHIIEMFTLDPADVTPLKDTFTPTFSDAVALSMDTDTVDLSMDTDVIVVKTNVNEGTSLYMETQTSSECEIVGTFNGIGYTPAKRNLEKEFDEASQVDVDVKKKAVIIHN